jgi:hypothetical protein
MFNKILMACIGFGGIMTAASTHTFAQQETTVKYNSIDAAAFTMPLEADKADVSNSIEDYFKNTFAVKSASSKGFRLFKAVSWPEVSTEKLDVYYKVEGRKGKSEVTMLVSKGYDNFISNQSDAQAAAGIKNFLSGLNVKVGEYTKGIAVAAGTKGLETAQKEYDKYVKKAEDLNKQKTKLEKEIADNQSKLAEKEKDLNKAKSVLDAAQNK